MNGKLIDQPVESRQACPSRGNARPGWPAGIGGCVFPLSLLFVLVLSTAFAENLYQYTQKLNWALAEKRTLKLELANKSDDDLIDGETWSADLGLILKLSPDFALTPAFRFVNTDSDRTGKPDERRWTVSGEKTFKTGDWKIACRTRSEYRVFSDGKHKHRWQQRFKWYRPLRPRVDLLIMNKGYFDPRPARFTDWITGIGAKHLSRNMGTWEWYLGYEYKRIGNSWQRNAAVFSLENSLTF